LALTALIAAVSILHIPPLGGVSAGVILVAMVWGFLGTKIVPGAPGGYAGTRSELARYGHRLSSGALLMLAGSAAGTTLANTPVMDSIAGQLAQLDITILGVIITVVIVVVLRLVGMPPPAIVLVAGPALVRAVPLDPEAMAVLLVSACTLGILLSPSSLISAMVSALTGWSPVEVSLTRHLPYVTLAGILACAYVMLIS
jgi:hypothetical protein